MIVRRSPRSLHVRRLLMELSDCYRSMYGSASDVPLGAPSRAFVAYTRGRAVGMVAVRRHDIHTAHIVRLYVSPGARGRGIGRALFHAALREASRSGDYAAVWDSGTLHPGMLALSESVGAELVDPFGEHADDPTVRCFRLDLGDRSAARKAAPEPPGWAGRLATGNVGGYVHTCAIVTKQEEVSNMTTWQEPLGSAGRMSRDDAKVALDSVVARSGFSIRELRRQADQGEFETLRARLAWIAVRAIEGA